jgi:hypothetical protein
MKECPKCHKSWPDDFTYCHSCGEYFPVPKRSNTGNHFWSSGCVVPAGVLLGWFSFYFFVCQQTDPSRYWGDPSERDYFEICCGVPTAVACFIVAAVWWLRSFIRFKRLHNPPPHDGSITNRQALMVVVTAAGTFMALMAALWLVLQL